MSVTKGRAVGLGFGLVVTLVASFPSVVRAQADQGPSMPGASGGTNMVLVLIAPAVQKELKLTDEQKTKVYELARDASRRTREFYQSSLQGGAVNPQAMMTAGMRLRQENEQAALKLLKPEQKERAQQILLRVEGALAVARPEIGSKLNLNQAQTRQVQFTMMQMMQAQRGMIAQQGGEAGGRSGMTELRIAAGRQIGRALDAKQKAAFTKMLGEPFDVSQVDPSLPNTTAASASEATVEKTEASEPSEKPVKSKARRKRGTAGAKKGTAKEKDSGGDPP